MTEDRDLCMQADSGQVIKLRYACWSRAGADPHGRTKQNQDAYIVKEQMGGSNSCLFAVFDGHGTDGAKVSRHLSSSLPYLLVNCSLFQSQQYIESFQLQMLNCNRHLSAAPHINSKLSGSTAIAALLQDDGTLTVANVGDSRCILGRIQGDELRVVPLSTDHTPEVPSEAQRILDRKGRIGPYIFEGVQVGPKRIWLPLQDLPGLSMTRAFGDELGATVGVISEPEIVQVPLGPDDKYVILCSDGLFEFMDNDYIMNVIHHQILAGWDPSEIAKCLIAEANRQWMEEEDGIIDDCTLILIVLDMQSSAEVVPVTPPQNATAQPIVSVAKAMNDIARQNTNLMTHSSVIQKVPSAPSLTKLTVKVSL